jgi:integrase
LGFPKVHRLPQNPFRYAETPKALGRVLLALEGIKNGTITERATWLAPRIFLRPSEIVGATWTEINFKEKLWRIDGGRMKMGGKHIVPLSNQVLEHLKALRALTGDGVFLFPSVRIPSSLPMFIRYIQLNTSRSILPYRTLIRFHRAFAIVEVRTIIVFAL